MLCSLVVSIIFIYNIHYKYYQFGFKSCHSTDLCIYTLKEYSTTVYVTFLDASKAFDRLNA